MHALCPPRGSVKPDPEPPRVSFPPRFGKMTWQGPAFGSSPHLFPPPTASPPLKRPPRSISEPALPKRARIGSPPEATAVSGPSFRSQAPVGKRTLDGFGNDFRLAGEPTLRQLEQARAPLLLASAPPPTMTKPLGALTLDEAFRDLLGADQLTSGSFDATPGGSGDPFGPFAGGVGSPFDLGGLPSVEPGSDAPSTAPGIEGELAPYADASRDLPEEDPAEMPPWWED